MRADIGEEKPGRGDLTKRGSALIHSITTVVTAHAFSPARTCTCAVEESQDSPLAFDVARRCLTRASCSMSLNVSSVISTWACDTTPCSAAAELNAPERAKLLAGAMWLVDSTSGRIWWCGYVAARARKLSRFQVSRCCRGCVVKHKMCVRARDRERSRIPP